MSDTPKNWKRGLLKAWLALSLLWAAGSALWLISWAAEAFEGTGWGLYAGVMILYLLPLGVLLPLVMLLIGWCVVTIIERVYTRDSRG